MQLHAKQRSVLVSIDTKQTFRLTLKKPEERLSLEIAWKPWSVDWGRSVFSIRWFEAVEAAVQATTGLDASLVHVF